MNDLLFINWDPPLGLSLGDIELRYYSMMFALAFYLGYKIFVGFYKREKQNVAEVESLLVCMLVGILLGARLGHVFFYDWAYFKNHIAEILLPFEFHPKFKFVGFSGLASHGGVIGGLIALYLHSRKVKKSFLWLLDRVAIVVTLGGGFVRIGNLINSEIIGKETTMPWGFIFKQSSEFGEIVPRHPSQLYEAICYFAIAYLLWRMYKSSKRELVGFMSGVFMIGVFGVRIFMEFFKENQKEFEDTMVMNMGQILSIPIVIAGFILIHYAKKNKQK